MATSKPYSVTNDTANGVVDIPALIEEIASDPAIPIALASCPLEGDTITPTFQADIDAYISALDTRVGAHTGTSIEPDPNKVEVSNAVPNDGVAEPNGKRARMIGMGAATITAGQTVDIDWLMPQLQYQSVNKKSIFNGVEYYANSADNFDKVTFQIVDKDGFGVIAGWYTQAQFDAMGNLYVIEEFATDWYIMPDTNVELILYKSDIVPGLYIRAKYESVGSVDVKFSINLFRHLLENS